MLSWKEVTTASRCGGSRSFGGSWRVCSCLLGRKPSWARWGTEASVTPGTCLEVCAAKSLSPPSISQHGSHIGTLADAGSKGSAAGRAEPEQRPFHDIEKGDPSVTIAVASVTLRPVQYLHRQSSSCRGFSRTGFTLFSTSAGMQSLPEAFPLARQLMTLLWAVRQALPSLAGRGWRTRRRKWRSSAWRIARGSAPPILNLLALISDRNSCLRLQGGRLSGGWACRYLDSGFSLSIVEESLFIICTLDTFRYAYKAYKVQIYIYIYISIDTPLKIHTKA